MRRKTRAYIYYIILTAMAMLCFTPAHAEKRDKNKKKHQVVTVTEFHPDPVARKSRPDRHPKTLEKPFLQASSRYPTGPLLHGIDVSHYQGRINWDEVARDSKITYVYLKATEGTGNVDGTYRYNFSECKRVGLKVGAYHFFRPHLSAKAQFDNFVSQVDTKKQDLLPVVDIETMNGTSDAVMQSRLLELCELLEKEYGKKPIIYTGKNFFNKHIYGNARLRGYKFFIAAYSFIEPELYGNFDYVMWQYSATGSVRGIRGNVDMSRFVGRHTIRDIAY
ncbi:MAG: glycosyl hydrolase family 25 [Bacteroidaceae bacterium]|nr:glycosyl hydrolase family 25 [Bacteroidaceae bacterium]